MDILLTRGDNDEKIPPLCLTFWGFALLIHSVGFT